MPYQVLPVVATVLVSGYPVIENKHILVDWANIEVDQLDKEDPTYFFPGWI